MNNSMPPYRLSRASGNPEARGIPGFRLSLAIASLAGMTLKLVREFKGHHTSLGVGLWLSALNVRYRDVRHMLPFITQLWFFLTPVAYASSLIPAQWRFLYHMNPMVGIVEGFRWALLGKDGVVGPTLVLASLLMVIVLIGALHYFQHAERTVVNFFPSF